MSEIKKDKDGKEHPGLPWKFAICPHDDYTYVGKLYPDLLQNIKAPNLILIGVAHKAATLHIEDSLVFDSYNLLERSMEKNRCFSCEGRDICSLAGKFAIVNDTLQKVEHSVEAMIPFFSILNRNIAIVPILCQQ